MIYSAVPNWTGTIGSGGVADGSVTTIPLSSAVGLTDGDYYILTIDRVDANGVLTPSKKEVVAGRLSGTNLINCIRGVEGTAQAHAAGAVVEMLFTAKHWNDLKTFLETEHNADGTHLKATGAEVSEGTDDTKIVTPKALKDAGLVVTLTSTDTLFNKRIVKRVSTITSSPTPTPDADAVDVYIVTALAEDATFRAPTGTPTEGQTLVIRIKDNGTARSLAWDAVYRASPDLPLPTTTVPSKTMYLGFIWNSTDSKWDLLAYLSNL